MISSKERTRRGFLRSIGKYIAAIPVLSSLGSVSVKALEGRKIPNVLLLISDQQRTDTLGFMGKTRCRTPNIDRLAAEGISFDRCLTPSPISAPARASIFSGLYPHQANLMSNSRNVTLRVEPVLSRRLRERGYHLGYAGKWHLGQEVLPAWFDRYPDSVHEFYSAWCKEQGLLDGFVVSDDSLRSPRPNGLVSNPKPKVMPLEPSQTYEAWVADHVISLIKTRPENRPFFFGCGFYAPHPPLKVPEPYYSMYDPEDIPQPPNFGPTENEPRSIQTSFYRKLFEEHGTDWEPWKKSTAVYWGSVSLLDAQVGRIIRCLEEEGELENTLIIFTSDHGELMGQHGLWQKFQAYEEALRVPLVMRVPWSIGGIRNQENVSLIDIAPTILSVAGANAPQEYEGIDLSPAFSNQKVSVKPRSLYSEYKIKSEWHDVVDWRLVTDNHYKYVWNQNDLDEIYDLQDDPYEKRNRIDDPEMVKILSDFRTRLRRWMRKTKDPLLKSYLADIRS